MMRLLLLLISLALTAQVVYSAPIASVDLEHLSARNKEVGKTAPTGGPRGPKIRIKLRPRTLRHAVKQTGKLAETAFSNGKGGLQQHAKNYVADSYNNYVKGGSGPQSHHTQSHTHSHTIHRQNSIHNPFHRRVDDDETASVNIERAEDVFADDEHLETRMLRTAAVKTGKLAVSNGVTQHAVKKYAQSGIGSGGGYRGHGTASTSSTVQEGHHHEQSDHRQNSIHNPISRREDNEKASLNVERAIDAAEPAVLMSRGRPNDRNKNWCSTCTNQTNRQQTKSLVKVGVKHGVDSVKTWAQDKNNSGGQSTGPHHPNVANPFT